MYPLPCPMLWVCKLPSCPLSPDLFISLFSTYAIDEQGIKHTQLLPSGSIQVWRALRALFIYFFPPRLWYLSRELVWLVLAGPGQSVGDSGYQLWHISVFLSPETLKGSS